MTATTSPESSGAPDAATLLHRSIPGRWVVKVGSNVLSRSNGELDPARIASLARQIAACRARGVEVVLVSSGAVAAGIGILGLKKRPVELPELQAVAAVGQGALMACYMDAFRAHGIVAAQVLLTHGDIEDRRRYLNARLALSALLAMKAVPIINENDTTTVDELKFGDNDALAALLSVKLQANLLVLLTEVPGLMTANPHKHSGAALVPFVPRITAEIEALADEGRSTFGTGGMTTKIRAALHATRFGVPMLLASGKNDRVLEEALDGRVEGTLFAPALRRRATARDHWIGSRRHKGTIAVDDGARRAIVERSRSLLPVGIVRVEGDFKRGDVVRVVGADGASIGHGIVNYDAAALHLMKGKKAGQLREELGQLLYEEAIHTDNLAVFEVSSP